MSEVTPEEELRHRTLRALIHAARNPLAALLARMELAEDGDPLDRESIADMREAAGRIEAALRVLGMVVNDRGEETWADFVDVWSRVIRQIWPGVRLELPPLEVGWVVAEAPAVGRWILTVIREQATNDERLKVFATVDARAGLLSLRCEAAGSDAPITASRSIRLEHAS